MLYRTTMVLSAAVLSAFALSSCGDSNNSPDGPSNIRVANAAADVSGLSAASSGDVLATGLNFQSSNATCGTLDQGTPQVDFSSGSAGLGNISFPAWPAQNYTVIFFGNNNAISLLDLTALPPSGSNAFRFVNAQGTAGDIYLTAPNGAIVAPPTIANLGPGEVSGFDANSAPGGAFVNYANGLTRVRMFNPGVTTGVPRADFTINANALPSTRVATLVVTPPPLTGANPTGFIVPTCKN
jgi:hypothetical protein